MEKLKVVNNHPVHIIDKNGFLSPTAFIPFCSFGGDMKKMGRRSEQYDVPVCNSFKSKIRNNQLCYQIDLEDYKDKTNIEKQLKEGLVLIMDYNEERQMPKYMAHKDADPEGFYLLTDDQNSVKIHLETISNYIVNVFI